MEFEIEVEVATLGAIAEAIEKGDTEPTEYAIAIQGVAARLRKLGERKVG